MASSQPPATDTGQTVVTHAEAQAAAQATGPGAAGSGQGAAGSGQGAGALDQGAQGAQGPALDGRSDAED